MMPTHREVIERLVAENAALRERCEAVVLAARMLLPMLVDDAVTTTAVEALYDALLEYDAAATPAVESEGTE